MKSRIIAVAVLSSVAALVPAAQGGPARLWTTEPTEIVPIDVTLRDSGITVRPKSAERGQAASFIVHNLGRKPHSFAVGSDKVVALHKAGLATPAIKPRGTVKLLLIYLDYRGKLQYRSTVKADQSNPRMKGFFTIR